jgi:thioredoxin reductase
MVEYDVIIVGAGSVGVPTALLVVLELLTLIKEKFGYVKDQ